MIELKKCVTKKDSGFGHPAPAIFFTFSNQIWTFKLLWSVGLKVLFLYKNFLIIFLVGFLPRVHYNNNSIKDKLEKICFLKVIFFPV